MSAYDDIETSAFGPNMWLIDEMYRRYQENPGAVDEKWRDFFEDFRPRIGDASAGEGDGGRAPTAELPEKAERAPTPSEGPSQPLQACVILSRVVTKL